MTLRLLLLATAAVSASLPARACSCAAYESAEEKIEDAEIIFVGTAEETLRVSRAEGGDVGLDDHVTRFWVSRPIKGVKGTNLYVQHSIDSGACGVGFAEDERVMVFAYRNADSKMMTDLCTMSTYTLDGTEVLSALGVFDMDGDD